MSYFICFILLGLLSFCLGYYLMDPFLPRFFRCWLNQHNSLDINKGDLPDQFGEYRCKRCNKTIKL